jgi:hypothetical protein
LFLVLHVYAVSILLHVDVLLLFYKDAETALLFDVDEVWIVYVFVVALLGLSMDEKRQVLVLKVPFR